jgi:hypothetical protein
MAPSSDPRDTDRRKYFSSVDAAISDLRIPLENVRAAREVASRVPHDTIYIPLPSRQYVALKAGNGSMAAHIDRTFAWVRGDLAHLLEDLAEPGLGWCKVQFPVAAPREEGGTRSRPGDRPEPPTCDVHFIELPATGVCDYCDD